MGKKGTVRERAEQLKSEGQTRTEALAALRLEFPTKSASSRSQAPFFA
jgi:hypothetical protein